MAASSLKTDFLTIGRSGPTVDGRTISTDMLTQAAANYDQGTFKALIWPEHARYLNMGGVESLRTAPNNEGGLDLQAVLSPNEFYLSQNKSGQMLFTSMELTPNFRKGGQWYLTGLGATDDPASAGTTEVRFSRDAEAALRGAPVEFSLSTLPNPSEKPWFARLFHSKTPDSEDLTMAEKTVLEALAVQLTKINENFAALQQTAAASAAVLKPDAAPESSEVEALKAQIKTLEEKFTSFSAASAPSDTATAITKLEGELKALTEAFNTALSEAAPGTVPGAHTGVSDDLKRYI